MAEIEGTVTLDSVAAEVPVIALAKVGGEYQILDSTISAPDGTYGLSPGGAAFIVALGGNGAAHGAVSGAALWTPAEITTALWLDAADAGTITEVSGAVSQWDDKSGNARHATQGAAEFRPAYSATGFNSLPGLVFGGDDLFNVAHNSDLSATGGISVFGAVKYGSTTNNKGWIGKWATKDWVFSRDTSGLYQFTARSGSSNVGATASHDTDPHFMGGIADPGNKAFLYKDGVGTDVALGSVNGSPSGTVKIGSYDDQTLAFTGALAEVIIIAGAVDTTTRQLIEGYLAWKWGLQANLPSGHPYKDAAPTV